MQNERTFDGKIRINVKGGVTYGSVQIPRYIIDKLALKKGEKAKFKVIKDA